MRYLIPLLLAAGSWAADPVGLWRFGVGQVDGQPAKVGTMVLTGQEVVAGKDAPLRLICHEAPGITTVLAAGSAGRFAIEAVADGGRLLVFELDRGAVQMDVTDKAPYSGIRVRGAALEVKVSGTLFVVERTSRDADYVALVRGKVNVGLKPDVAKTLGKAGDLELNERQGVSGDTTTGVGTPTDLTARPQITFSAAARNSVADQGSGASDQGTDWGTDLASELTGAMLEGSGAAGMAGGLAGDDNLFIQVAEELADSFSELGTQPEPVVDQASQTTGPGTPSGPAGLPPPPPPPLN